MKRAATAAWLFPLLAGCASTPGPLFPAVEPALVWPAPPDAPRVRYVGQITTEADLHGTRSLAEQWRSAVYGPEAPQQLITPHAVAVSADGAVLAIADTNAAGAYLIDLNRRTMTRVGSVADGPPVECATGVAFAGDLLCIADSLRREVIVVENGAVTRRFGSDVLQRPAGLAYNPHNDRLLVTDSELHALLVFDLGGNLLSTIGTRGTSTGEFNFPSQVACAPDGTVAVADSMNFRVQLLTPEGEIIRAFGQKGDAAGDFALPKGVAFDAEGNLWVSDAQFENVQAFDREGNLLLAFGSEGSDPGRFWLPAGLCIDGQRRLWVADTYNRRVQVFELMP